jgi:hypothetical protein
MAKEQPMSFRNTMITIATITLLAAGLAIAADRPGARTEAGEPVAGEGPTPHTKPELLAAGPAAGYPHGCVDCHTDDRAETIGSLLAAMGHRNVDARTQIVPNDCAGCHSEEGGFSLMQEFSHLVHYANPERNAFVQDYGGLCLHCHLLDTQTGDITMKAGPKNW